MQVLAPEAEVGVLKGLSRPFKVCFEGIDGCGKSTQVDLLVRRLREERLEAAVVKHPGFTRFGREVRRLLLSSGAQADAEPTQPIDKPRHSP